MSLLKLVFSCTVYSDWLTFAQDVSGKDKGRPLWNRYFSDTIAVIWVVDSTDQERFQLCRQELHRVLREPELSKAVILVYVNKQDLREGERVTFRATFCLLSSYDCCRLQKPSTQGLPSCVNDD